MLEKKLVEVVRPRHRLLRIRSYIWTRKCQNSPAKSEQQVCSDLAWIRNVFFIALLLAWHKNARYHSLDKVTLYLLNEYIFIAIISIDGAGLSVSVTRNRREMRNTRFDSNSVNRWRIRKKILLIVNIYSIIRPVTSIFT